MGELRKIIEDAAGIDIGSEKVFVGLENKQVKSFRTFTRSYYELCVYLKENKIKHVAMEATGIYWCTLYDILEQEGFDVCLVNPSDTKNFPGRKTDVQDCQWIQTLYSYGLLRKSFVPENMVRKLRVYTRMREDKIQMGASHINHMQKALIQMNIRLPEVLSQTHGVSGLAMIKAILGGEKNAQTLLSYCTSDLRHHKPKIDCLHEMLLGIHGANPTVLPGLTDYSLMRLTAELGNDINQWPNVKSFVSWLGLAPGKNQSGKMNKRSKKRAITRGGQIFKIAAQSLLVSSKIGLGVFAKKLKARKGAAIAIKATARKIAELYYNLLKNGLEYVESGIEFYKEQQKQKQLNYLTKKANELNLQLVQIQFNT